MAPHFYVSAAGHLSEVLLLLQCFIDLVVGHAEAAQTGLDGIVGLGENDKLGHVRDANDLPIHLSREVDRLLHLPTVYEPEPEVKSRTVSHLCGCKHKGTTVSNSVTGRTRWW